MDIKRLFFKPGSHSVYCTGTIQRFATKLKPVFFGGGVIQCNSQWAPIGANAYMKKPEEEEEKTYSIHKLKGIVKWPIIFFSADQ